MKSPFVLERSPIDGAPVAISVGGVVLVNLAPTERTALCIEDLMFILNVGFCVACDDLQWVKSNVNPLPFEDLCKKYPILEPMIAASIKDAVEYGEPEKTG